MICIGGPLNGKDVNWSGEYFKAPDPPKRKVDWKPSLEPAVLEPIPIVTYYRQSVTNKSGHSIPIWVAE